jgi:hypothetical protein
MVLGHYGLAFAARRYAGKTSLGTLVLAAQLADEVWPLMLLAGLEKVSILSGAPPTLRLSFTDYPWTHSLATQVIAGVVFGLIYFLLRRDRRGALIAGALVPSHWVLDAVVHVPDLPVWPGGPKVGLGLWRSVPATITLELLTLALGVIVYCSKSRATSGKGRYLLHGFLAFLLLGYLSSLLGPPPENIRGLAMGALILWILVPWAYWLDSARKRGDSIHKNRP